MTARVILAITGASGAAYGLRLAQELLRSGANLAVLISDAGFAVLREEHGLDWKSDQKTTQHLLLDHFQVDSSRLIYHSAHDFLSPVASGSSAASAMVVCPSSMGTVARIACGLSTNLIERCADVMLKERRPLVLVPRETPLNEIHLENMLKLCRAGARIIPAMPAFYHGPRSVAEMVDFVVGKVLDSLGVEHALFRRWQAEGREN